MLDYKRKKILIEITNILMEYKGELKINNNNFFFDINNLSEYWMEKLLNLIYGINLKNLNSVNPNFPAIDLGDEESGVCYQITSSNDREKMQSTLNGFEKHRLYKDYNKLYVLVLGDKKNYKKPFEYNFDVDFKIKDIDSLIKDIEYLDTSKLEEVLKLLNYELKNRHLIVNFKQICEKVSKRNLSELVGVNKSIDKQYVCIRENIEERFQKFVKSNSQIFSIIGPSGYGKTNNMYALWENMKKENRLFFDLSLINTTLKEEIEWNFKEVIGKNIEFDEIIMSSKGNPLYIFIDGLDEYYNLRSLRNEVIKLLKSYNNDDIKIVISCRNEDIIKGYKENSIWEKFIYNNGIKNLIYENMLIYENECSFKMSKMNGTEIKKLWSILSTKFNSNTQIDITKVNGCDIPQFLFMLSETFSNDTIQSNLKLNEVYNKWFNKKISKFANPGKARIMMITIANKCFNKHETLTSDIVRTEPDLFNNFEIINEALKLGVLKKIKVNDEIAYKFTNLKMMLYIIFFKDIKIDKNNILDIERKLNIYCGENHILALRGCKFSYSLLYNEYFEGKRDFNLVHILDREINTLCPICNKKFEKSSQVSIIYSFNFDDFENTAGEFNICHEKCVNKGNSILDLSLETSLRHFTINDLIALENIEKLLIQHSEKVLKNAKIIMKQSNLNRYYFIKLNNKIFKVGDLHLNAIPILKSKKICIDYIEKLKEKYKKCEFSFEKIETIKNLSNIITAAQGNVIIINKEVTENMAPINIVDKYK